MTESTAPAAYEPNPLSAIFFPYATRRLTRLASQSRRLVHYTSAEAAIQIIKNRSIWMRNARVMNDFSEIQYGSLCLKSVNNDGRWKRFISIIDNIFPDVSNQVLDDYNGWFGDLEENTYLLCLSEHKDSENDLGRLSMWRAYGRSAGVALVLNNTPFLAENAALEVFSSPVLYSDPQGFIKHFEEVTNSIEANCQILSGMDRGTFRGYIFAMLRAAVLCTKHPAFLEEKEWRVIYLPGYEASSLIPKSVELINGIPQIVHRITLESVPDLGVVGLDPSELLSHIIVGPTEFPDTIRDAFLSVLNDIGVPEYENKVVVSRIPLRT